MFQTLSQYCNFRNNCFYTGVTNKEKMNKSKIKLVVFKEHTLGYILEELPKYVQVFHSSVLKGAPFELHPSSKLISNEKEVRLASKKDFEDFRHCWSKSYESDPIFEYEYQL